VKPAGLALLLVTALPALADTPPESGGKHYQRAIELYAGGPDAAAAILSELDLEIADYPDSVSARVLKARVLKGTDRCKEALVALDDAERILEAQQSISGSVKFLQAECLYYERRYAESRRILTAFRAFMQSSDGSWSKHEELLARVLTKLAEQPAEK
jgi:hypothetical protein